MKRAFFAFLLLILMASTAPADSSSPIKIGISLGLTGRYSEMSYMQIKALKLWERDVNAKGGILGRKVKIIAYDDRSDPNTAKFFYDYLINKMKVDLLLAPYSSELTYAVAPMFEKYGYPTIASGASADRLWEHAPKYLFGIISPASKFAVGFVEMIARHGFTSVAIAYSDDPFPADIANGTRKWVEEFGLKTVLFTEFKKGTRDLDGLAQKVRESHAQVLIVCGYYDDSINMRLAMKRIGWYPKVYYASVGPAIRTFHDKLGQDADYTFSSALWEPHGKIPGSIEFYESYLKSYGQVPSYHAAEAYAAAELIEKAIKKAGSVDREKIREILSSMQTTTIVGRYGVDKTCKQVKHFPLIIQWQNGRKEIVWPKNLSTSKPLYR